MGVPLLKTINVKARLSQGADLIYGVVSQLARESDSYPEGRWFEPSPRYYDTGKLR